MDDRTNQAKAAVFHNLPASEVLKLFDVSRAGLEPEEAARRLARYGHNRLPEPGSKTLPGVFLAQFKSPFIYLLLAAGIVSVTLGHTMDAGFIAVVLLLNATIGTSQEWSAETRARALKALIVGSATVRRGGRFIRLSAEELVPGDVIRLESGERVAADVRLLEARNLMVDESLLTGESLAVRKSSGDAVPEDAPLGDRSTMLHAGTTVRTGRALGVVVATARRSVVGQLAGALEKPEPRPPLVRRMARFTRHVAVAMLGTIAVITVLEILRGVSASDIFVLAVALAVSAIPEGLPIAMTVALSISMRRMGLRHVVVRRLAAVEGLGACTLIATDKTGTLTLNQLTVSRLWTPERGGITPGDPFAETLLVAGARASEPLASEPLAGEGSQLAGDAVDVAFHWAADAFGAQGRIDPGPLVGRIPYEPEKRFAAAFNSRDAGGEMVTAFVKGAPETVLSFCANADEAARDTAHLLAAEGYRVIAVAAGEVEKPDESALRGLSLLGLVCLNDPLREGAKEAVDAARKAGLRVVLITGDHPLTALAIARELGLAETDADVVTGSDLAGLQGAAFDKAAGAALVFARTEPMQKLAIVESLRRQGHVVAVTGDGVNDAAALHAADIGIAMGKGGTDVARDAADLILTDDNFASIVAGIEEGRIAYDNLRKVILLCISTGSAEILLMLLAALSGLPPPLTAVQLLWLNFVTNGIQDVSLAFERGEPGILMRRPRPARQPIFDRRMIEQVVLGGGAVGLLTFGYYCFALGSGAVHATAQGAVLWLMVWCENAHCFNCRSERRSIFAVPLANNPLLIAGVVGTQLLQIAVLGVPPIRDMLSLQSLSIGAGMSLAFGAVVILAVMEAYKWFRPSDQ